MWSDDVGKDHFIGESLIDLDTIDFDVQLRKWYELCPPSAGEIKVCLTYEQQTSTLTCMIYRIRKLNVIGVFNTLDTYVKVFFFFFRFCFVFQITIFFFLFCFVLFCFVLFCFVFCFLFFVFFCFFFVLFWSVKLVIFVARQV